MLERRASKGGSEGSSECNEEESAGLAGMLGRRVSKCDSEGGGEGNGEYSVGVLAPTVSSNP